jgi:hypothetical protein
MNFKQLVLEELINYDHITLRVVSKSYMNDQTGELTPTPTEGVSSTAVYCFKDNKNGTWWVKKIENWQRFNETPKDQNYRVIQEPSWYKREKGGYKRGVERHGFRKKIEMEIAPKQIEMYELKQSLTPQTRDTFGDLIGEL